MELQGARQRSPVVALAGMHDQAGGLVEDDDRVVLVNDIERNVLRGQRAIGQLGQLHRDDVIDSQFARSFDGDAVNQDRMLVDRPLKEGPTEIGEDAAEIVIDAPTVGPGFDRNQDRPIG